MIKTERLTIKPIELKYYKDLFELWSDFETIKYTYLDLLENEEEAFHRIVFWLDNHLDLSYPNNLVITLEDRAIGLIGFPIINKEAQEFGFYYQLNKDYWGKGYITEAVNSVIEYIYEEYKEATIYADAVISNPASIKVLENSGFEKIHVENLGFKFNNFELDLVKFIYKNKSKI